MSIRKLGDVSDLAGLPLDILKASLKELNAGISDDTPIDTSTLINSWRSSVGAPSTEKPAYSRPFTGSGFTDITSSLRAGQTFYHVNNQDYAPVVEYVQGRRMLTKNILKFPSIVKSEAGRN